MNKKIFNFMSIILLCIMLLLLDWYQWDIIVRITTRYNGLVSGLFYYLIVLLRIITVLILLVLSIKYVVRGLKKHKIISFLPLIILTLTIMLQFVIPMTDSYAYSNYLINKNNREKIILMVNSEDKGALCQTNVNTYVLPLFMRASSHNAKITTEYNDGALQVLFYIHKGIIKNSAIIYTTHKSGVKDGDFCIQYDKIIPMDTNWYIVKY